MIRSMSSALSGLRNHQVMIDIVGNNIANVSTVGFKSSTAVFSDVLSQTLSGAGTPGPNTGGTNPAQIGLGSKLAGTPQSFVQGSIQRTGRTTDIAIQGDGFFVVTSQTGESQYTRAGAFNLDAVGNLTTPDGKPLMGWMADGAGNLDTNTGVGPVQIQVGDLLPPKQTELVDLGGNLPADAPFGTAVMLAVEAYDTKGVSVPVEVTFTKTDGATLVPPGNDGWAVTASFGNPATPLALAAGTDYLEFDGGGELAVPGGRAITITGGQITDVPNDMVIDLGTATQPGRLTQFAGAPTAAVTQQDGSAAGTLVSFNVSQDGVINGTYSSGLRRPIGQIAMAVFTNPGGLERIAGTWRATPNSGLPQVGTAGSGGRGLLSANSLEMSNVDLAEEFTRLIVAQRGFQGNARVITTSDEVLQEVVNLRR